MMTDPHIGYVATGWLPSKRRTCSTFTSNNKLLAQCYESGLETSILTD
jgi:hypothetical protein